MKPRVVLDLSVKNSPKPNHHCQARSVPDAVCHRSETLVNKVENEQVATDELMPLELLRR
jgi:hypothetical protein